MNKMVINNLNYLDFDNLSLRFIKGEITFIIGDNNSGKTTLFKIFSGEILLNNVVYIDGICYNNDAYYYNNIGIVKRVNENSFYFKKVMDELLYSLLNRGYSKNDSLDIIKGNLNDFGLSYIINKNISDLNIYEKQKLLVIMGIINNPKVLLMDNPLDILQMDDAILVMNILKKKCNDGLSIIYFSNNLDYAFYSNRIMLFNKFHYIGEYNYQDLYNNDKIFYDNNIEIPFLVDLNIKLNMYNIINKNYDDIKVLVDDIWD